MGSDSSIPKEIEVKVRAQIEPLFNKFYASSDVYKTYFESLTHLNERLPRAIEFIRMVTRAYEKQTLEAKLKTAIDTLLYLTQIELVGTGYVDMVIMLLVANGRVFHIEPDDRHKLTRHVVSTNDLDSPFLTLAVKLDFLKMNGVTFFEDCIDKKLRNNIAHGNFEINEDGKFFRLTQKGKREQVDIFGKYECFVDYITSVMNVFKEQTARVSAPPK